MQWPLSTETANWYFDNLYKVDLNIEYSKDPKNEHSKSGHPKTGLRFVPK